MFKNSCTSIVLSGLLAVLATPGLAQDPPSGPPRGPGPRGMLRALHSLELPDEQNEAIRELLEDFRPRLEAAHRTIRELDGELSSSVKQVGFDPEVLAPLAEEKGRRVAAADLLRAELEAAIRERLTPEQLSALDERELEMQSRGDGGRGERGGRPRGHQGPRRDLSH